MENEKMSRMKLSSEKSMDILSTVNDNSPNVKLTTNSLLSNDTNRVNQYADISTCKTQPVIGTNPLPNFSNKFVKLQLKTKFECHDYDEQITCKKIELKKYVEFDTSSFWNKNN
ncbi:unnamed protein product [Cercopithifilaria johnstoni]|nr:unnamed protein product [Cercopithifilaria johnstoni]